MRRLLLEPVMTPIGQPLGMIYRPGEKTPAYRVRVGDNIFQLSPDRAVVWDLAHRCYPGTERAMTRAELDAATETYDAFRVADVLDWLCENELIAERPAIGTGIVEFAKDYRLGALMTGLGNAPDRKESFAWGAGADGFALTSLLMAEVLARGASMPSLYAVCEKLAPTMAAGNFRELADASLFATHVVDNIQPQLEAHAAYFDLALEGSDG